MGLTRKQKLKRRERKQTEQDIRRAEALDRVLAVFGVRDVYLQFPEWTRLHFLHSVGPSIEVVAAEDCRDAPEVKVAVRELKRELNEPVSGEIAGRPFYFALQDYFRGYHVVKGFFQHLARNPDLVERRGKGSLRHALNDAVANLEQLDRSWFPRLMNRLYCQFQWVASRRYRVDGKMIATNFVYDPKNEKSARARIVVRLHHAHPQMLRLDSHTCSAYPCTRNLDIDGLSQICWNLEKLGIDGPKRELPLFVAKHALLRLHERVPMRGAIPLLHNMLIDCLEYPVITPRASGEILVDADFGFGRVGYFVARVYPRFVLIKTFLFLTMQGTPEAEQLRQKLGLFRVDIERYKLDDFYTLTTSDIVRDPLLRRALSECGCGHLISLLGARDRTAWIESHGNQLKKMIGLREAQNGFVVNNKWMRWTQDEPRPFSAVSS